MAKSTGELILEDRRRDFGFLDIEIEELEAKIAPNGSDAGFLD